MAHEWTEEQRKAKSEQMSEHFKNPDNIQKLKDGWKKSEKYLKNEGKHQMEDDDQKRAYQREYHRDWYQKNKEKVQNWTKAYYERTKKN